MITRFQLENFKAHRNTDLRLQQFTVLVGDNGSGKTSVLEALRLPGKLSAIERALTRSDDLALHELLHAGAQHMRLSMDGSTHDSQWITSVRLDAPGYHELGNAWRLTARVGAPDNAREDVGFLGGTGAETEALRQIPQVMGDAQLYRFHWDEIAASAYSDHPAAAVAEDGALTAVALAGLKLADDEAFDRIETAMRKLVPSLQRVFIKPATVIHPSNPNPVTGSKLYFDFRGAKGVPAHHASQGTLVVLALLTVLHGPSRPSVILLDDFDHSLHPRAQMELARMIKELLTLDDFKDTQIIATTHSPYVLDEVSPSEVIAFALREDGTVAAKPLSEHPDAPRVNGSLKAGELWTLDAERDWVR